MKILALDLGRKIGWATNIYLKKLKGKLRPENIRMLELLKEWEDNPIGTDEEWDAIKQEIKDVRNASDLGLDKNPTIIEILKEYLRLNYYDGLKFDSSDYKCECYLNDLCKCTEPSIEGCWAFRKENSNGYENK